MERMASIRDSIPKWPGREPNQGDDYVILERSLHQDPFSLSVLARASNC